MQKMTSKVSNKKDRINKKIKDQKLKCELCGYEGQAGEFVIEDLDIWNLGIKNPPKLIKCRKCEEINYKYYELVMEKTKNWTKKEADQA